MATGKSRANRRSSGGSCSSTATTTVFVLVCVLFLWMFTSNSLISPQKKTNNDTSILDSFSDSFHRKIILPAKIPTEEATTAFEDNPGDLPEEAMKSGDDPDPVQETDRGSSKQELKEAEYKHEHESNDTSTVLEADDDTVNDSDAGKQEAEWQTETIMPDNRHTEKLITAKESSENEENRHGVDHLTDEEQEKRIDDQQQREEEQSQHSETSDDQVQHDEDKPIESYSNATETKTRIENQESDTTTPKKDSNKVWSTQVDQSTNQNGRTQFAGNGGAGAGADDTADVDTLGYKWELCNVTSGTDYIPCLDNEKAIRKLHGRNHFEHRERHCPEEGPVCLVPLPEGYKTPIPWPQSRDKTWFHNVPYKGLADVKGHQNWVKATGELLTFPGGGTQFIHGALQYIDFMQQAVPDIAWGKHTRVILDVGCGVASFGGYLFDRDVLAMSFAPKDEHEAQVQLALERGIPAVSAVMGTQRLPFPSKVFDLVHCARCRVPWHKEGGRLLLEVNRVLRPGGYFVWSATPVYQKLAEDVMIWNEMSVLTLSMCWELVTINKDKLNGIGVAIYRKPDTNECYNERNKQEPPMCKPNDDANAAWYVPLQPCIHKVPVIEIERSSQWPEEWPSRIQTPPYWLNKAQIGIHGKPAPDDFKADYEHWKWLVSKTYMSGLEINWSNVRNVMDMRAVYGGFAAALKDLKLWVLNVVNVDSPDTLPIIFERGLFGIYHDWCESFSTYPRTYDLLHADHLFSKLKKRCKITPVMAEVDRIVRPGGKLIVRDESNTIGEIENLLKSLHWEVHLTYYKNQEQILSAQKSNWRPKTYANPS